MALDMEKVCLVCLQHSHEMVSISDQDGTALSVAEKIEKCVGNLFDYNCIKSSKICDFCLDDLSAAYRFLCNCESSAVLLRAEQEKDQMELEDSNTYVQINLIGQDINLPDGVQIKNIPQESIIQADENLINDNESPIIHDNEQPEEMDKDDFSEFDDPDQFPYEEEHLEEDIGEEVVAKADIIEEDVIIATTSEPASDPGDVALIKKRVKNKISKNIKKNKVKCERTPKVCNICGNNYKYQHALNAHMRRHTNERPFNCELCDKAFVSNVEMQRHMRVHTGYKPYGCQYCERRFSDYGSRIKHERTHTGEKPFTCHTCNKSFAYAHVLSVHIRTHTGEKKFQCTECGKGFTKKSYMLNHMEQHARAALITVANEIDTSNVYQPEDDLRTISQIKHESLENSLEECITAYIVEEVEGETGEDMQVLQEVNHEERLPKPEKINEKILGL